MKTWIAVGIFLVALSAQAGSWETGGFRTANGQLIQAGMTKAQVLRDAGQPNTPVKKGKSSRKKGDAWTYKGNDGYYTITFKGDRVTNIEVTPFRDR